MSRYQVSEQFYEDIITLLGGTLVDVELNISEVSLAYHMAKKTYIQRGHNNLDRAFYPIQVEAGKTVYTVDSNIDVVNCIIKPSGFTSSEDPFTMSAFQNMFGYGSYSDTLSPGSAFMTYELTLNHLDNIKQKTVHDMEYVLNKRTHTLQILKSPKSNQTWLLDCFKTPSDEILEEVEWILRYTLAECKMFLGRAYRKFSSISTPSGDNQLDGDNLVREGQEEKQRLEDEILEHTSGDAGGLGIFIG